MTYFRGLSGVTLTSAPTGVGTLAAGEPLHRKQRSWPLDHQWCLMLPWSGQGFPPHSSPQASRLLSRGVLTCWWVSEMLKKCGGKQRKTHWSEECSTVSGTVQYSEWYSAVQWVVQCSTVSGTVQYSESYSKPCSMCDVWISRRGYQMWKYVGMTTQV